MGREAVGSFGLSGYLMAERIVVEDEDRSAWPSWKRLRCELVEAVEKSVTDASSPHKAAEYVANMLTVHRLDLLRALADEYAPGGESEQPRSATPEPAPTARVGPEGGVA